MRSRSLTETRGVFRDHYQFERSFDKDALLELTSYDGGVIEGDIQKSAQVNALKNIYV